MVRTRLFILISSLMCLIGGAIWIWKGSQLSVLPPADPELGIYRNSHFVIMPWLGLGLACIGIGLAGVKALLPQAGRLTRYSFVAALIGSFVYFFGTITRLPMDLSMEYDPIQPIGFILAAIGLLLFSLSIVRSKALPLLYRLLLLSSAICLLVFNDQYISAWSSIPFGMSWIGLGLILFTKFVK